MYQKEDSDENWSAVEKVISTGVLLIVSNIRYVNAIATNVSLFHCH